ncbi:MAG: hypothetical protein JO360_07520 [Acidobacteria bacterium]|nr:hypothetical protein [Acidobacteriota bacterium]
MNPSNHEVHRAVSACRRRVRRTRAGRRMLGRTGDLEQAANRDSNTLASEIDRRAPTRARFEVREEADAA